MKVASGSVRSDAARRELEQVDGQRTEVAGRLQKVEAARQEGLARVATILKQRRQHHYVVVADAKPHDEVR